MINKYEVLIDGKWYEAKLSKDEYKSLLADLNGELNTQNNILLVNKKIVETGIIDDVRII